MALVKKRESTAITLKDLEAQQKQPCCFRLFSWLLPKSRKTDALEADKRSNRIISTSFIIDSPSSIERKKRAYSHGSSGSTCSASSCQSLSSPRGCHHRTTATQVHTWQCYALKSLHLVRARNVASREAMRREMELLKHLDHPSIVRILETYEVHQRYFAVLELCRGGDLYTRDPYTEYEAWKVASQLVDAVAYLHERHIVHRDLKYENIMFVQTNDQHELQIKLIDFGLAKKFGRENSNERVGTVYTMAPEVLSGSYNAKADVWSLGVIVYMLLSSSIPFKGKTPKGVLKRIRKGVYSTFSSNPRWDSVSNSAKCLVKQMLTFDHVQRPLANDVLNHPWLAHKRHQTDTRDKEQFRMVNENIKDAIQASMQAYAGYGTIKKIALLVIANRSSYQEVGMLHRFFAHLDVDHSGNVSKEEFSEVLSPYNYNQEQIDSLYEAIDADHGGDVSYIEFLASTLEALGPIETEHLAEAFDRMKSNSSGFITTESRKFNRVECSQVCVFSDDPTCYDSISSVQRCLGGKIPPDFLVRIINEADANHDRRISFTEYMGLWNREAIDRLQSLREKATKRRKQIMQLNSYISPVSSEDEGNY